jgi:hypothetical protein
MSRFVVDLGDVPITDAQKNAIASSIQQAVLSHLATTPAHTTQLALIPKGWYGIVFRPNITELQQAEQQIEPFAQKTVP